MNYFLSLIVLFFIGSTGQAAQKPTPSYDATPKLEAYQSYTTPEAFATLNPDYQFQYASYISAEEFIAHSPMMHSTLINLMPSTKLVSLRNCYLAEEEQEEHKKLSVIFSRIYPMRDAIQLLNTWYNEGNLEKSNFRQKIIEQLTEAIEIKKIQSNLFEPLAPASSGTLKKNRPRATAFSLPSHY